MKIKAILTIALILGGFEFASNVSAFSFEDNFDSYSTGNVYSVASSSWITESTTTALISDLYYYSSPNSLKPGFYATNNLDPVGFSTSTYLNVNFYFYYASTTGNGDFRISVGYGADNTHLSIDCNHPSWPSFCALRMGQGAGSSIPILLDYETWYLINWELDSNSATQIITADGEEVSTSTDPDCEYFTQLDFEEADSEYNFYIDDFEYRDYMVQSNDFGDFNFYSYFPELCEHTEGYYSGTAEGYIELNSDSLVDIESIKIKFTSETTGETYSSTTEFNPVLSNGDNTNFSIAYSLTENDTYQVKYFINTRKYDSEYHLGSPTYIPVIIPALWSYNSAGNIVQNTCMTRIGSSSVIIGYDLLTGLGQPEDASTTSKFDQLIDLVKQRVPFNYVSAMANFLGYLYNPTSTDLSTSSYNDMFDAGDKFKIESFFINLKMVFSAIIYLIFGFTLFNILKGIGK